LRAIVGPPWVTGGWRCGVIIRERACGSEARKDAVPPGAVQGVLPGATAGVEHGAGDPVGHVEQNLLRAADVAARLAGVGGLLTSPLPPTE
jgi:hypothetical protein